MSLKICEECGFEYSDKASACPKCGCPNIEKVRQDELIFQHECMQEINEMNMAEYRRKITLGLYSLAIYASTFYVCHSWFHQDMMASFAYTTLLYYLFAITMLTGISPLFGMLLLAGYFLASAQFKVIGDIAVYVYLFFPIYYGVVRPIIYMIKYSRCKMY